MPPEVKNYNINVFSAKMKEWLLKDAQIVKLAKFHVFSYDYYIIMTNILIVYKLSIVTFMIADILNLHCPVQYLWILSSDPPAMYYIISHHY